MLGLTDNQLRTVMDAAAAVPIEKRDLYLQRIAAMLAIRGRGRFTDTERVASWQWPALSRAPTARREFGFLQSWGQALTNPLAGSPLKQKIRYVARETKLKLQFRLSI